jgi:hypothetical protein
MRYLEKTGIVNVTISASMLRMLTELEVKHINADVRIVSHSVYGVDRNLYLSIIFSLTPKS